MSLFKRILRPQPPQKKSIPLSTHNSRQTIDTLARTIWGEARGESILGKEAVANVILNRVKKAQKKNGFWWGNTIEQVCLKPYQFSCWNKNDPNYQKLKTVNTSNKEFNICLRVARRAVHGVLKDNTNGATHYHTKSIQPYWAVSSPIIADIGHHVFYRLEG